MSVQDDITRIVWNLEVPPHTSVSIDTCNHDVETRIEPVSKHDGNLGGDIAAEATVEYYQAYYRVETDAIHLSGGYGDIENSSITLDAKQALSLLAWLLQEKGKLEELAKERAE